MELLIALFRSDTFTKKPLKILVTGSSDAAVDTAAMLLHKTRESMFEKLGKNVFWSFIVYHFIKWLIECNCSIFTTETRKYYEPLKFVIFGEVSTDMRKESIAHYTAANRAILPNKEFDPKVYNGLLNTTRIVFSSKQLLPRLKKYANKFDVILMDNASECNELCSTLALLYSPSSLILFGDPQRTPKDTIGLEKKYPKYNRNGSMFHRLHNRDQIVVKLENCYRFAPQVLSFLNERFYNRGLVQCAQIDVDVRGICVFHNSIDEDMSRFFMQLLRYFDRYPYKIGVILPPNHQQKDFDFGWVIKNRRISKINKMQIEFHT